MQNNGFHLVLQYAQMYKLDNIIIRYNISREDLINTIAQYKTDPDNYYIRYSAAVAASVINYTLEKGLYALCNIDLLDNSQYDKEEAILKSVAKEIDERVALIKSEQAKERLEYIEKERAKREQEEINLYRQLHQKYGK